MDQLPHARITVADHLVREIDSLQGVVSMTRLSKKFSIPVRKMERIFNEQAGPSLLYSCRYSVVLLVEVSMDLTMRPLASYWMNGEETFPAASV